MYKEYAIRNKKDLIDSISKLNMWGIESNDTLDDLKQTAQTYLNNHKSGMKIGSPAFSRYVKDLFYGDSNKLFSRATEDKEFGALYAYMCLYYEIISNNKQYIESVLSETADELSILEIVENDFKYNFVETTVPIMLREYVNREAPKYSSPWPALNGKNIRDYAREYSKTEKGNTANYFFINGADCTNFASQALFYGGLYKTYYASDTTANGYVETQERWFYFKNNTSAGHSVSTFWVRVSELYNYLSPHYATLEKKADNTMTPYLNKGFVLQGKHFWGGYKHSVIITQIGNNPQYCAHSSIRHDEPINTFYDGFYKCRVIQTY